MSAAERSNETRDVTLVEAVNMALHRAMEDDENVVVLGEDIATNGGVFRATVGLKEAFGFKRVMDTPLAENLIAGTAIGMATQGLRPVAEFQFMGFIYAGMEQIVSHAARMRNRTRGRLHCPLVFRAPFGGGIHAPEHHSESTEALFAHIPGLRVVIPSSPQRAYGLLLAAIRNPDPVIFLEPKRIYRAVTQNVEDNGEALPLDTCFTLREGDDVTLITWGACVMETLQAADKLAEQGVSCEVIDVATVSPLDRETLLCSVAKTGRAVIIHEACRNGGVGAEVAASIAEAAFLDLQAPVVRVTGYDTVMPYYRNEQYYLPQVEDIVTAVEQVIAL
ncbi:alpha-ketoacid dehydrogenase subunit beta [Marinobacter sp. UBA3607]|jgi:pyruvate dehydrogenase E1 component beta subunit|uniref:alpha-ketoacid dehydrogenase subunit beta n=1 Tax=Marinobacter sp. UBA3607 TaxID=1946820 RepID=UPI00257DCE03|nr:alpha-ketoacid dehydrogenase subunit beta [Marinobacter sp. UBA3607]|tara:strand:+ start:17247 stop:18251 length:1005 start_codon:yes stop_codon:yes gene_type:complete